MVRKLVPKVPGDIHGNERRHPGSRSPGPAAPHAERARWSEAPDPHAKRKGEVNAEQKHR